MKKVLCIGEILVEIVASTKGEGFREALPLTGPYPSGAPAIFIDQVGKLGHPCAIISCVGDDDFGHVNLARLQADNVDTSGVQIHPEKVTGSAFVRYREDGNRDFIFNIRNSACGRIGLDAASFELIETCDHIHVMGSALNHPSTIASVLTAISYIKKRAGTVSFDPNLRPELLKSGDMEQALREVFAKTDLLLPSGDELYLFTEAKTEDEAISELLEQGIKAVVLKRGSEGASYYDEQTVCHSPGISVEEVDPTGAGDCFGGTFVKFWLDGVPVMEALRYACAAGALAVTKTGPMEGNSTQSELKDLITKNQLGD